MIIKAGLVLDLGNSETRCALLHNRTEERFSKSNFFAPLPYNYVIRPEYQRDKESATIVHNDLVYANGRLCLREFKGVAMRPTAKTDKCSQITTDLSIRLCMANAICKLAQRLNVPYSDMDIAFDVSLLLPPSEFQTKEAKLIEKVKSVKTIELQNPVAFKIPVKVGVVNVFPEGFAAFMGALFDDAVAEGTSGAESSIVSVENNEMFQTGYNMVIDIGAGTTDVVLVSDSELIHSSYSSYDKAGNVIRSKMESGLYTCTGFVPDDMESVVQTGFYRDGAKLLDASKLLLQAKHEFVADLCNAFLLPYMERQARSIRDIKGILVCGGGSLSPQSLNSNLPAAKADITESCADMVVDYLKKFAPNVELIKKNGKDSRGLNLDGAVLLHKYRTQCD